MRCPSPCPQPPKRSELNTLELTPRIITFDTNVRPLIAHESLGVYEQLLDLINDHYSRSVSRLQFDELLEAVVAIARPIHNQEVAGYARRLSHEHLLTLQTHTAP